MPSCEACPHRVDVIEDALPAEQPDVTELLRVCWVGRVYGHVFLVTREVDPVDADAGSAWSISDIEGTDREIDVIAFEQDLDTLPSEGGVIADHPVVGEFHEQAEKEDELAEEVWAEGVYEAPHVLLGEYHLAICLELPARVVDWVT